MVLTRFIPLAGNVWPVTTAQVVPEIEDDKPALLWVQVCYAQGFTEFSIFFFLKYSIISSFVIFDNFSPNLLLCSRINSTASNVFLIVVSICHKISRRTDFYLFIAIFNVNRIIASNSLNIYNVLKIPAN